MKRGTKSQIAHKWVCLFFHGFFLLSLILLLGSIHLNWESEWFNWFRGIVLKMPLITFLFPVEPVLFLVTVVQALRKSEDREPFRVHLCLFCGTIVFMLAYIALWIEWSGGV